MEAGISGVDPMGLAGFEKADGSSSIDASTESTWTEGDRSVPRGRRASRGSKEGLGGRRLSLRYVARLGAILLKPSYSFEDQTRSFVMAG